MQIPLSSKDNACHDDIFRLCQQLRHFCISIRMRHFFYTFFYLPKCSTLKKNKCSCYYGFSFSKELYFSTYDETLMNSLARSNNSSISSIQNILSSLHSQLFNALNENQYDTNKWAWLYVAIEGSRKSVIFCISV